MRLIIGLIISTLFITLLCCSNATDLSILLGKNNIEILVLKNKFHREYQIDTFFFNEEVKNFRFYNENLSHQHFIYVGEILSDNWYPLKILNSKKHYTITELKLFANNYFNNISELCIDIRFNTVGYVRRDLEKSNYQIESVFYNKTYYIGFLSMFFYDNNVDSLSSIHADLLNNILINENIAN